jgi:hypothetical protein
MSRMFMHLVARIRLRLIDKIGLELGVELGLGFGSGLEIGEMGLRLGPTRKIYYIYRGAHT